MRFPFKIQKYVLPAALQEVDVIGVAKTGSGKTLAFLVPVFAYLAADAARATKALVLAPTRELANQIFEVAEDLSDADLLNPS